MRRPVPALPRKAPARPEEALARVVLRGYLGVRPGEAVTIEAWSHALAWARPFVVEARRRGAEPSLVLEDEEAFFRSLALLPSREASRKIPMAPAYVAEGTDVYVYFPGPEAFPRLLGLPEPDLESTLARHGPGWWRAARRSGLRAARLAISIATPAAAERYRYDLAKWQREIVRASLVPPDHLVRTATALVRRLGRARRLRIRHYNGTDLEVGLVPHTFVVEDGKIDRGDLRSGRVWTQVPTGLLAVPVAEGIGVGRWESNRPVYDRFADPPRSHGIRFEFARGRLGDYSFERGGEAFAAAFDRGGRGREVLGAVSFGLNHGIDLAPELAELAWGTVGLWLGDNRWAGGRNRSRFRYVTTLGGADLFLDGRTWWVGGRPLTRPASRRLIAPTGPSRPEAPERSSRWTPRSASRRRGDRRDGSRTPSRAGRPRRGDATRPAPR